MVAAQAQDKKVSGGTEQTIAALEQEWADAMAANKTEKVAPLLADKYITTDSSGQLADKARSLALMKASKWEKAENRNVKVTVFGKTAIAIGEIFVKGTDEKGKPFESHERWTDTWLEMSTGKWQCVASHTSTIKT
jgi:ketosteroid isomerase-like protein